MSFIIMYFEVGVNSQGIYPISYVLFDHFVIQFFEENIQLKQIWAEMKSNGTLKW